MALEGRFRCQEVGCWGETEVLLLQGLVFSHLEEEEVREGSTPETFR